MIIDYLKYKLENCSDIQDFEREYILTALDMFWLERGIRQDS